MLGVHYKQRLHRQYHRTLEARLRVVEKLSCFEITASSHREKGGNLKQETFSIN